MRLALSLSAVFQFRPLAAFATFCCGPILLWKRLRCPSPTSKRTTGDGPRCFFCGPYTTDRSGFTTNAWFSSVTSDIGCVFCIRPVIHFSNHSFGLAGLACDIPFEPAFLFHNKPGQNLLRDREGFSSDVPSAICCPALRCLAGHCDQTRFAPCRRCPTALCSRTDLFASMDLHGRTDMFLADFCDGRR